MNSEHQKELGFICGKNLEGGKIPDSQGAQNWYLEMLVEKAGISF